MIKKAFGGILLVDEAYYLYNAANDKDYGQESIEILLNVMEEQKEDLIVTLAGCVEVVLSPKCLVNLRSRLVAVERSLMKACTPPLC